MRTPDAEDPLDDATRIVSRDAPAPDEAGSAEPRSDEPEDGTLLVRRGASLDPAPQPEEPDDGTLLVRRGAPADATPRAQEPDEATRLSARPVPADTASRDEPEEGTLLVRRPGEAQTSPPATEQPDDSTLLVRRPAPGTDPAAGTDATPGTDSAPAVDEPDDGTLLVRRPADAPDDSTRLTRRPAARTEGAASLPAHTAPDPAETTPSPAPPEAAGVGDATAGAVPEPAGDDATRLTRRPPAPDDRTRITRRPAPEQPVPSRDATDPATDDPDDSTRLGSRGGAATEDAGDAERTRLGGRRGRSDVPADGTALSPRSRRSARTRAAKAKAQASLSPAQVAPEPATTDEPLAKERYAIRTRQVEAAPPVADTADPASTTGDGGLAARIARRRTLRTRLTVLVSAAAALTVGSLVGLVLLIAG